MLGLQLTHGSVSPVIPWLTIQNWKKPRSKLQLQQFLGTCGAFRDHIPNMSQLTRQLDKLCGNQQWKWEASHDHAFREVKAAMTRAVSLAPHTPGVDQDLLVDASDNGLGVILKEKNRVIAIISRKLTTHESQYDTKERELLAVKWATEKLYHFTHDATNIRVHTDHRNLVLAPQGSASRGRINRSWDWLANFHITWHFIPGRINPADGPSRLYD